MKHGRLRGEATRRVSRWTRTSRAVLLAFAVGVVAVLGLLLWTVAQHPSGAITDTVTTQLGPLVFFESVRSASPAGTTATLDLGFGVAVLLLVLPAVTGALAWSRSGVQADGSVRD